MSRPGTKSAFFQQLDDELHKSRIERLAQKANEVMERDTCKNCGALVYGHIADTGLVVNYGGYKFCSDACVENWVDQL